MSIEVRNFRPIDGSVNVPISTDITFDLVGLDSDEIDIDTLSVEIETVSNVIEDETNTVIYDRGVDSDLTEIQFTGDSTYYRVQVVPGFPFDEKQTVTIRINVSTLVMAPASPEAMAEFEATFNTLDNGIVSDFKFAFIDCAQMIPVYAEILRPNDSTNPTIFNSAFDNWNIRPDVVVRRNQLIIDSGYTIDYKNGKVIFDNDTLTHGAITYEDQIDIDYNFAFFSDEQIIAFLKQANAIWNIHPPAGGPNTVFDANANTQQAIMIGGALYAFKNLLLSLAIQEKRIIFDNESWDDGWKNVKDIFNQVHDGYKEMWNNLLEAKKVNLPRISSIVTPSYTLPGGRSRFFRYVFK